MLFQLDKGHDLTLDPTQNFFHLACVKGLATVLCSKAAKALIYCLHGKEFEGIELFVQMKFSWTSLKVCWA